MDLPIRLRRARRSFVCWAGCFDLHYNAWGALVLFGRWTLSNWFVAQTPRSISILIPFKRRDSELFNNMNIMPIYSIGQEQESNRNFRHFRFEFPSTFHLNFRSRFWRMEREDSLLSCDDISIYNIIVVWRASELNRTTQSRSWNTGRGSWFAVARASC